MLLSNVSMLVRVQVKLNAPNFFYVSIQQKHQTMIMLVKYGANLNKKSLPN